MLQTIRGRLALHFTLLIAGLMLVMLALTGWLGYGMVNDLRPRLQSIFAETQTLNEKNVLLNSANYLRGHLFPHLDRVDIAALNKEIDQVKAWLPIKSFIITDANARVVTDGSIANYRYGQPLALPREPLPGQPILDAHPDSSTLSFAVGADNRVAGYAVITLSNTALQASLQMLDQQVTAQWEHASVALLLGAGLMLTLVGSIGAMLIWRVARSLSQPITEMVAAAESCANGNLDIALPVRSSDELGHLARALNTMAKELKVSHRRMRHLANYDALTGLPNRHLFQDRLRHALYAADRSEHQIGLMFLDLDGFKAINDSLGHALGDEVLKLAAARLRETVRASDTVARLGGDEFTVVAEGIHGTADVVGLAEKLLAVLAQPYSIQGHRLQLSASIGVTLYPEDGTTADALLHSADSAMYEAKRRGKNAYCRFTPELDLAATGRLSLEQHLPQALSSGQLELHYQPQIHIGSGHLVGAEALLRWQSADASAQPGGLIARLEDSGIVAQTTAWILDEGCRALAQWRAQGLPELRLAINLAGQQLTHPDLLETVSTALARAQLPPDALEFEITENSLLETEHSGQAIEQLQGLGVRVAIDNFGTGYSSVVNLHRLAINTIKIDRSLIQDIATNEDSRLVTSAIVSLAKQLGIETAAQGVETDTQCSILQAQGCDILQGYRVSEPLPAQRLLDWAKVHRRSAEQPPQSMPPQPQQFTTSSAGLQTDQA
ncbi:EAL domain-containing protein [Thiorhodococcus mannitoliphagus]|uniref:EAL domain-containing protein n=1 Tax=Thiorhodococcus mannitoliphagus TaxID=329406 RepID=A0A6P1E5P9_9GAMM|nr:EAL domain-containing protein [Thiorhodococcus mannitoliphagus]NEX23354.1 EAL domain-containing protein [Thiorhodococcus mannitoliphagus]